MTDIENSYIAHRRNRTLTATLWIVFVVTILFGVFNINLSEWRSAAAIFGCGITCLVSVYLNSRKHRLLAIVLLLTSVLGVITYSIFDGDGLFDPGIVGYPLFILLGTMLLNKRATPWLFLAAILSLLLVAYSQANGFTRPTIRANDVSVFLPVALFMALASLIIWVIQDSQEHDLEQIRRTQAQIKEILVNTQRLNAELHQELLERQRAEAQIRQLNEELEHRVRERTAQLEFANKELESFSYSVSHDLRAPLRAINGFSRILNKDFSDQLDPMGRSYLQKIMVSGNKMTHIIDDLLDFARLGRKPLNVEVLDLKTIAQSVVDFLAPETTDRQIEWILEDTPTATGDPGLIQQVYANLIGNAVKYTGKCPAAHIEIGSVQQSDEIIYFVRDNGVGFDMQYADRLFEVFQRLHNDFEGNGIGLAIVRRIVERHGGRIWAEAEPGKGATFYFTLSYKGEK